MAACGSACSSCAIAVRQSDASHSSGTVSTGMSAALAIPPERTEPPPRTARSRAGAARAAPPPRSRTRGARVLLQTGAGAASSSHRRDRGPLWASLVLVLPLPDGVAEDAEHVLAGVRGRLAGSEAPDDLTPPAVDADDLQAARLPLPQHLVEDEVGRLHERLGGLEELRFAGDVFQHLEVRCGPVCGQDHGLVPLGHGTFDVEVEPELRSQGEHEVRGCEPAVVDEDLAEEASPVALQRERLLELDVRDEPL